MPNSAHFKQYTFSIIQGTRSIFADFTSRTLNYGEDAKQSSKIKNLLSLIRLLTIQSAILLLGPLLVMSNIVAAEKIIIGQFSQNDKTQWENHSFQGITDYSLVRDNNIFVLRAESNASASGLINRTRIDLAKTPFLNWRWKVDKSLYKLAETFKEGDDFAARIYIIVDGGIFFWKTLALNYVWSGTQTIDSLWDNPFTANAKMIAVQSGDKNSRKWQVEKQNVRIDLRRAYGKDIRFIDAVAIMTDTDNSKQKAIAYYGDIYFSDK